MKSIKIKLKSQNKIKNDKLLSIFDQLDLVSKEYLPLKQKELETKTYKPFKEYYNYFRVKYPTLNSIIIQSFLRQQDNMVKSFISWCKKKHRLVHFPENVNVSIPLRNDMFHFEYNQNSKMFNAWIKFLKAYYPLNLCDYHIKALKSMTSISDSTIIKDQNNNLFLRLNFKTKNAISLGTKTFGIDLGIVKPIVCSDGKQFGSGPYITHKKLEFGKQRAKHQKLKDQITLKQNRWTNDLNHKLSRELVDYCSLQGIGVLALEDLKGNHLSNKKFRKYSWAFKDLISKIKYKAEDIGLKVISVDPRFTSQTCSSCGQKDKTNRISQGLYSCSCGFKANADINAAKNIQALLGLNGLPMNLATGCIKPETQPSLVAG